MSYAMPDNPEELKAWMEEVQSTLIEDVADGHIARDKVSEIHKAEAELKAQVNELARQRWVYEEEQRAIRERARKKEQALELARQKYATFMSEKAIHDSLKEKVKQFELNTIGAPWREFAFPHQIDGAQRLSTARRAILGDKRGLGKTLESIMYMDMVEAKKVLVIAPKDTLRNFGRELDNWSPNRKYKVIGGMPRRERHQFLDMCAMGMIDQFLILVNYEAWRRDSALLEKLVAVQFDTIIIDEAHNIKTASTDAFKGIKHIAHSNNMCPGCGGQAEQFRGNYGVYSTRCSVCLREIEQFGEFWSVKNMLPMTGTAILNKPQDLWTLLHLVDPVEFPTENTFLRQYCFNEGGRWKFKYGGAKRLTDSLGMRYVARDEKTAGVTMPKQDVTHHYIAWDDEAKAKYPSQHRVMRQIREYGAIKMAENVQLNVVGILSLLTRQRQAVVWPAGIKVKDPDTGIVLYEADAHESIKMDKAEEIVKEAVDEEDRVVVFSQFKEGLKELERRLVSDGISVVRYDGDTPSELRNDAQNDFDVKTAKEKPCNNHPPGITCTDHPDMCNGYKWQVILCNYKTGGVGLNLNAARQMVILDREWNPGKEDQAQGRIQRLNTKHETIVHIIHVEGTVDNFMDNLMEEKAEMIDGFDSENHVREKMRQALLNGEY